MEILEEVHRGWDMKGIIYSEQNEKWDTMRKGGIRDTHAEAWDPRD